MGDSVLPWPMAGTPSQPPVRFLHRAAAWPHGVHRHTTGHRRPGRPGGAHRPLRRHRLPGIAAGLNLIDTAPAYEQGYSEQIVGQAVRQFLRQTGRKRSEIFVIDKIDHHDQPVGPQVEQSLSRLEMPGVDLLVFHGLSTVEGWQKLTAAGGGFDQLARCQSTGRRRSPRHTPATTPRSCTWRSPGPLRRGDVPHRGLRGCPLWRGNPAPGQRRGHGLFPRPSAAPASCSADTTGYNQPLQALHRAER